MGQRCVRFKALCGRCGQLGFRLSIGAESAHDSVMPNQAPLHSIEIIFYSAASFLAVVGLTWFLLR
jgi:hypothetical protein